MNKTTAIKRLAKAVAQEAATEVAGDIWEDNWSPEAHVTITLTIDELRCAAMLHAGNAPQWWRKPSKKDPFA